MGSNVESGAGEKGKLKSPLYSNGTSEMETQKIVGAVEGFKSGDAAIKINTSNAIEENFGN